MTGKKKKKKKRLYPFAKVLIANRGEIACRIVRTLRERGIASVAIHHPVEAGAACVNGRRSGGDIRRHAGRGASRYRADRRRGAARGAEAIHPGYGFLSENARFAAAVKEAGLVFIGPDSRDHRADGRQNFRAKFRAARKACRSRRRSCRQATSRLSSPQAAAIGFPLLIKAAAGGGGKGMSIVRSAAELAEAARIAASEAQRYFGDGRIYAETYVERPRHIEVQVAGDGEGRAIHLFERECSVQRRFQKIVEEAPAANLARAA